MSRDAADPGAVPDSGAAAPSTRLLIALALATALAPLNSTMIAVALPAIGRDLHRDVATLTQWLVGSYLLVAIVAQSPAGKLGDRFGHGRTLHAGQVALALGAVTGMLAESLWALTCARVLMAVGGAVMVPSVMALVRGRVAQHRRGHAYGAFGAIMALAAGIGPTLGGELVTRFSWRAIFVASVIPVALSALLGAGAVRREPGPATRPRFDLLGSLLEGAGLSLLIVAVQSDGARALLLGGAGLSLLVGFGAWELRAADPVLDLRLFRCRPLVAGCAVIALQNLAFYGLLFQLPFFFSHFFGASSAQTGRALLPLMAMVILISPLSGAISHRVGPRGTAVAGAAIGALGIAALAYLGEGALSSTIPALALFGLGLGLSSAPSQAAAMNAVEAHQSGMAAGLLTSLRYLGGVAGTAVLGLLLREGAAASLDRHRAVMAVFAAAFVLSAIAALGLPARR